MFQDKRKKSQEPRNSLKEINWRSKFPVVIRMNADVAICRVTYVEGGANISKAVIDERKRK